MSVIMETRELCKYYGTGEHEVKAVDHTNLKIERGEYVVIVGRSGSGKSTLLHLLGGLDQPTKGEVRIGETDLFSLKEEELTVFRRRRIGFVFQAYNLISSINVWENTILPIGLDGREPDFSFVEDILQTLGLQNKKFCLPSVLSGGQQQRAAIARAVASRPEIILADEPTGNLDSLTGDEVIGLLKHSAKKYGQTLVLITHDEKIAQTADRIIYIEDGRVVNAR